MSRIGPLRLQRPRLRRFTAFGCQVETWVSRIVRNGPAPGLSCAGLLAPAEVEQAAGMADPGSADRFLAGRALTRLALARRHRLAPARIELARDERGRPYAVSRGGPARLDFNLSHTGDFAAVAVAVGLRVGIDIETVTSRPQLDRIAARVFTEAERSQLRRAPADRRLERWYALWTSHEALAKCTGEGLRAVSAVPAGYGHSWLKRGVPVAPGYQGTVVVLNRRPAR
ncbi:4'-phosphopantetheinyl transferase family protein [Kitasatospora azatica]|uniref:4'-phosphopantetheinyl transferase family protein n=1 Tax=Kitasatospora azatica TaxID=58347 RepID=UPI00068B6E1A|nr:4'-phosphopantetheinyl transferase superfamily protein [Kitasatospora azatica]